MNEATVSGSQTVTWHMANKLYNYEQILSVWVYMLTCQGLDFSILDKNEVDPRSHLFADDCQTFH